MTPEYVRAAYEAAVIEHLRAYPGLSEFTIARATGMGRGQVLGALRRLSAAGRVTWTAGRYDFGGSRTARLYSAASSP